MSVEVCKDLVALDSDVIIRGVRTGDWEYEQSLAQWNKTLGAETVFLPPEPAISHISSSAVRELVKHNQDVSSYVNKEVFNRWILMKKSFSV
jgi:pantetheine-phosphate adenylyltransferase